MKIVQFMASEKWGGAEKVFVDLSNELSHKHSVIALLLRDTEYKGRLSGRVEIVELQSHPTTHNPLLLYELYKVVKKHKPDIVHTHAVKASSLLRKVGYFRDFHHVGTKHNARKGRIFNKLKWVSAVSKESAESIINDADSTIKVIHNGILPEKAGNRKILDDTVFRIAAIGRLDKIKGFDVLIKELKSLDFPFRLTIAGEGPEKKILDRIIAERNMQDRVELGGFCDNIPELMRSSHMVVISSHSEGFPQVMVESLFYANVLISTPVGGVKEILPSFFLASQSGIAEKIRDVYRDYQEYKKRFSGLKKKRSNEFHLTRIGQKYVEYYQEIVNGR